MTPEQSREVENTMAPAGQVWVCLCCGKRSRDLYGMEPISRGWDASCSLNCALCLESHLVIDESGRVVKVEDGGIVREQDRLELEDIRGDL